MAGESFSDGESRLDMAMTVDMPRAVDLGGGSIDATVVIVG
jgi:hypothetical protein